MVFDWLKYRTLHPVEKELRKTLDVYTQSNLSLIDHFLSRAEIHAKNMDVGDQILPAEEMMYNELIVRADMRLGKTKELKRLKRYLER